MFLKHGQNAGGQQSLHQVEVTILQSLTGIMEGDAGRTADEICDNEILQTAWKAIEIKNKQLAKLKSSMQRGHGMNLKNKTALGALLTP